jgi:hypothetical protein
MEAAWLAVITPEIVDLRLNQHFNFLRINRPSRHLKRYLVPMQRSRCGRGNLEHLIPEFTNL